MKKLSIFNYLTSLLIVVSLTTLSAQSIRIEKVEKNPDNYDIPYEKWELSNGLTVIIHEDHSDPIVDVRVTYHVGSAREESGKSGFAHFFEHMMFQGSAHVGDEEHIKKIQTMGGSPNGYTTADKTVYLQTIPVNQLETVLWMEADRMGFLLDVVTEKKFEIQRDAVKNEKAQNQLNRPYGMTSEILGQTLYPSGHPYSWPTIGYIDDLNRAQLEDVKNFFLRWYGPNNAILTIAGDVNPANVLELTEKYFGPINKGPIVKKQKFEKIILPVNQYGSYNDNIYLPLTLMVFPTIPAYHRDEAALDILANLMGDGKNSIFYKNFIKSEKALSASVSHPTQELAGEFRISIMAYPSLSYNEIETLIRSTIEEFEKTGITEEAIQRIKTLTRSGFVDRLSSVSGKASLLAGWKILLNKQYNFSDDLGRYEKVSKEDIIRVFNKYIKNKNTAIVNVYPMDPMSKDSVKSINPNANIQVKQSPPMLTATGKQWTYKKPADNFDRSMQPAAKPTKSPKVPEYYTTQFDNGIKIIGTQTKEVPKIVIIMSMEGGNLLLADDLKKTGLAGLTSGMLNEGTQNYTTEQISDELDNLGSSIYINSGNTQTVMFVESFIEHIDATLQLLEEKLFSPGFREDDFIRLKKQKIEALSQSKKNADNQASMLFNNILYKNTIAGVIPREKILKNLTLDDVKWYYNNYYSPSVAKIVIVGDIAEDEIISKLDFLKKWEAKPVKIPEIKDYPEIENTQIYLLHKLRSPSSVIIMGHHALTYDVTGEYYKTAIMNYPLGGAFNSRINLNLREDKGYTYGISARFSATKYLGTYFVQTNVKRAATDSAIVEIMKEFKNYAANGITDEELTFTKNSMLNSESLRYETPYQKASFLSKIIEYDLSKDFTQQRAEILKSITKEDINALFKKYIHTDKMVIVVVGNKFAIKKPLETIGYKVKEISLD